MVLRSRVAGLSWLAPLSIRPKAQRRSKADVEPVAMVRVELTRIAPRALDDDNLRGALKAVRDGVADVLGIDDRDPRVVWDYEQAHGAPREYGVKIVIRPSTNL
jgi:hypothetical protein